jgi:hypothetical protein
MSNKAKNNEGSKGYRDSIINQLDVEVVDFPASENQPITEDPATRDMSVNPDSGSAYGADMQADPDPVIPNEMKPYNKEHTVPESAKVQGNKSSGLGKNQEVDSPADDSEKSS